MMMNAAIPMSGVQPDFANALAGGVQAGQAVRQAQTQNALAELFKTQGAGIMSGDQNALNALAQLSPDAALGIMNSRHQMDARNLDMQATRQRMDILSREEARRVEEYAATKTAAERAAEAAQIEDAVKQGMLIQTPEQWDQVMATQAPDLVGQFGNRDALAGKYMTMAEILKQQRPDPAAVTQGAPTGYMWTDPNDRTKGVAPIAGYQAAPADEYGRYVQEELQAGRKPISRIEFEQAKKGKGLAVTTADGTSISFGGASGPEMGKLSTDYGYVVDPETGRPVIDPATGLPMAAPVPGSPAAQEAAANAAKKATRDTQATNSASIVLGDIDRAIEQVSGWTAGAGGKLAAIPGTAARDLQSSLDTVKANIGFDRLQQMREASPTGGALGGIAVQELQMLQAVLGSLDQEQSPEQLKANLERLRKIYEPIAAKAAAYPNAAEFGFGGQTETPPADMSDDDLLKMYGG